MSTRTPGHGLQSVSTLHAGVSTGLATLALAITKRAFATLRLARILAQQAPGVIRGGKGIEIWATSLSSEAACQDTMRRFNGKCVACRRVEAALNERYKTIEYGWATKPN